MLFLNAPVVGSHSDVLACVVVGCEGDFEVVVGHFDLLHRLVLLTRVQKHFLADPGVALLI